MHILDFQTPQVAQKERLERPSSQVLKLGFTTTEEASKAPGMRKLKLKEAQNRMMISDACIFTNF